MSEITITITKVDHTDPATDETISGHRAQVEGDAGWSFAPTEAEAEAIARGAAQAQGFTDDQIKVVTE